MNKISAFFTSCLLASSALAGAIKTQPWLQNVYTNRFTVMCETSGKMDGLTLQYAQGYAQSVQMSVVEGLKDGTFVCKAEVLLAGAAGETIPYQLMTNGVTIAGTQGSVKLWKDGDKAFSCAIWGDNQEGVQKYDWGNDVTFKRYQCIRAMFQHMSKQKPDFGFSTGDMSSKALYDEEILPGELNGADQLFGSKIPYHLVWGNHDCNGTFLTETYTDAVQRYFSPAASEQDGWFYLYRNDVLFIGVHWTWGQDGAEARYAAIAKGVEDLLKTDRAKKAKFRVLVQHAPIFLEVYNVLPKLNWFGDTRLLDVAKAGGVDVVFSGHTHAYERIERDGLVQVVNGGMGYLDHGERWYNNYGSDTKVGGHQNTPLLWSRQDSSSLLTSRSSLAPAAPVRMGCFQGYGLLSVTNNTLTYTAHAFNADGSYIGVADSFSIASKTSPKVEVGGQGQQWNVTPFTPKTALASPINNTNWSEFKASQGEAWRKPAGVDNKDPVVNVSKTEIERFCAALNAGTPGAKYRLPTLKELTAIFGGNLARDVSEWTSDVDPNSGWCRILGGNKVAINYTWCREYDKPAMASPDCHANYLGFRVVNAEAPSVDPSAMDQALAKLAKKVADGEPIAEVYLWSSTKKDIKDITSDWTNATLTSSYDYRTPVIFTGKGDLTYIVSKDITFGGGVAAPNATSLNFSHALKAQSNTVTVKGEFRGGVAKDEWRFYLKCDALTLNNVKYRGQVFNAVTDDRTLNLVGTNDFSGAVMSVGLDSLLKDPNELFVTNLVAAGDAMLWLRRLDFTTRGVAEEVLRTLVKTAGFTVGEKVALVTSEDVLFGIKGATLKVDGALDAAGIDIAGHLLGLLPQTATVTGAGKITTTHFGMCDKSTLAVGVTNLTLLSSVPSRTYGNPAGGCNVKPVFADPSGNPMKYFRAEEASAYTNSVWSLKNVQDGELYTMVWDRDADYHLDRVLAAGCKTCDDMMAFLCTNVLNRAPVPGAVTSFGCSAFSATNAVGQHLVGRNFDYRYPMTHALVYVPGNAQLDRPYGSVCTVDCGWLGYDIGSLDDGKSDLSYAALFPHLPMDGLNEAGLSVSVLSLDARKGESEMTEQFYPGRTNIVTLSAIRYLLDHADSTEAGVHLLTNRFNLFVATGDSVPVKANYHFYLCDKSGDARVVEWLPPTDGSRNWTSWVTNATEVSNFYLADGYGHGSNRWEIMRHALVRQQGHLEEDAAMDLCRAVSQKKGAEQTSWTHWSVVYNLDTLSANIATLGNYDEIFPYRLGGSVFWSVSAPKSARPSVETDLPLFDAAMAEPGMVYQMTALKMGGVAGGAPGSLDGAGVSAVNRMGCAYDTQINPIHGVIRANFGKHHAAFYVDMSEQDMLNWPCHVVAGVNTKGLSARIARFAHSFSTESQSPSVTLVAVLTECETAEDAAAAAALSGNPSIQGAGVIFTDAKGNVAIWPEGAEPIVDDASEMVRNSLDLRKGIYETDGDGRGQFDELPGLMRLASTADTKAIVSMGYGHLDVMLPGTNRLWRVEVDDASVPVYGIIAEPPAVSHATLQSLTYADGDPVETNNQGRIVAPANARMKVTYTAEGGYYFVDGSTVWEQTFDVSKSVTTVPVPPTPVYQPEPMLKLGAVMQRYPWNGIVDVNYRTAFWPAGRKGRIEVTVDESVTTNEIDIAGSGIVIGTAAIELPSEKKGKATFRAIDE